MRPLGSQKALHRRRLRAVALLAAGQSAGSVARGLRVALRSVLRWKKQWQVHGTASLAPQPVPGRPHKLKPRECRRLLSILVKGALAYGLATDCWTLKRIARVIRQEFGVLYNPNHLWRVLHRLDWSCQVPERRAMQRDEQAIAQWRRYKWPHIKKSPTTWGPSRLSR